MYRIKKRGSIRLFALQERVHPDPGFAPGYCRSGLIRSRCLLLVARIPSWQIRFRRNGG